MDEATQDHVAALELCNTYVPLVGTHVLSQWHDHPEGLILEFSMCFHTSPRRRKTHWKKGWQCEDRLRDRSREERNVPLTGLQLTGRGVIMLQPPRPWTWGVPSHPATYSMDRDVWLNHEEAQRGWRHGGGGGGLFVSSEPGIRLVVF